MKKAVYAVGAHPDDLVACAGLFFLLQETGKYDLHACDLTRGERGLTAQGVSPEETGRIREAEERRAFSLLGIEPEFLGEMNGDAFAHKEVCERLAAGFAAADPSAVITHWPVNTHVDHVICYATVVKALKMSGCQPDLLFFEESIQSRNMPIDYYVGFGEEIMQKKLDFISSHVCQNTNDRITRRRLDEARYHGFKSGFPYAEPYDAAMYMSRRRMPEIFDDLPQVAR